MLTLQHSVRMSWRALYSVSRRDKALKPSCQRPMSITNHRKFISFFPGWVSMATEREGLGGVADTVRRNDKNREDHAAFQNANIL